MQPLAENRYTLTKPLFYEGALRVLKENLGSFTKKALIALTVLWAVLAAATLLMSGSLSYAVMELIVLAAVGLWLCVLMPRGRARKSWQAMESKYGEDTERVTSFYLNLLEVQSGDEKTSILYKDIRQILTTKNMVVLVTADNVAVLVSKNSFVKGSMDSVLDIIERKMEKE